MEKKAEVAWTMFNWTLIMLLLIQVIVYIFACVFCTKHDFRMTNDDMQHFTKVNVLERQGKVIASPKHRGWCHLFLPSTELYKRWIYSLPWIIANFGHLLFVLVVNLLI